MLAWTDHLPKILNQRVFLIGAGLSVWQAVCNKIRRHSDVDVRLSDVDVKAHVDVRLSNVDVKPKTSTWNSDDETSAWKARCRLGFYVDV